VFVGYVLFEDISREEGLPASLVDALDEEGGLSLMSHRMPPHFLSRIETLAAESALEDGALAAIRFIFVTR